MYERILLPTDGSPAMGSTIEQCIQQATQSGATVHALYVVDIRAYVMLPDETAAQVANMLAEEGRRALDAVSQRLDDHDIEHVDEIREGIPHETILAFAAEQEIDLIVMGTHGRTGDSKRIVGSVAEEVVRGADVPVLTVRMSEVERKQIEEGVPEEQQRYLR